RGAARGAMDHFHRHQPDLRRRRGNLRLRERGARRYHRVQHGQRHRDAHPLEDRPAGNVLLRDQHVAYLSAVVSTGSAFAIWNAALFTMPYTNEENRLPFAAAFFAMERIVG